MSDSNENLHDSTRKHIYRKLQSELGDSVQIFPDNNGRLLIVSSNLSLQDVILENKRLHQEIEISKTIDFNKIIDQASSKIRSVIKSHSVSSPWPYHPSDVSSSDAIPKELERFFCRPFDW